MLGWGGWAQTASALIARGQAGFFGSFDLDDDAILNDRQDRAVPEAPEGVVDPLERWMAVGGIVFRRTRGGKTAHGWGLVTGLGTGVR